MAHLLTLAPWKKNEQKEHPDSLAAANMRACCEFRAGGAAAALHALGTLPQQLAAGGLAPSTGVQHGALVRHNAVVFGDGQGGMQVRQGGGLVLVCEA